MGAPSAGSSDAGGPLDDPLEEALRLVRLADDRRLEARLFGGLAIRARLSGWRERGVGGALDGVKRQDIDVATRSRDVRALARLLADAGYEADAHYNALYGHKQLYFLDVAHDRPLDVIVDALEMCHRLDFSGRLSVDHLTLPLAELLLSKLQIVRLTRKDALHALVLLANFPLDRRDDGAINLDRIVGLTASDWGWWRTVTGNLDGLERLLGASIDPAEIAASASPFDAAAQVGELRTAVLDAPKSRRWHLRSRVGDRLRWYEEPEEVAH